MVRTDPTVDEMAAPFELEVQSWMSTSVNIKEIFAAQRQDELPPLPDRSRSWMEKVPSERLKIGLAELAGSFRNTLLIELEETKDKDFPDTVIESVRV